MIAITNLGNVSKLLDFLKAEICENYRKLRFEEKKNVKLLIWQRNYGELWDDF